MAITAPAPERRPTPNTTLSVTCTSGLAYIVALDGGTTAHSVLARTMTDGSAHTLSYGLYTAADYATLWGDATGGTATLSRTGNGAAQSLTVYGQITAAQYVPAGSYTDAVSVTVTY